MDDITGAGPEEEAVRAGQAKPATEQEEGLGEPDSSSPDDKRDDADDDREAPDRHGIAHRSAHHRRR